MALAITVFAGVTLPAQGDAGPEAKRVKGPGKPYGQKKSHMARLSGLMHSVCSLSACLRNGFSSGMTTSTSSTIRLSNHLTPACSEALSLIFMRMTGTR